MSPLPEQFASRWGSARAGPSYDDSVCWHLLLGSHPEVRAVAGEARRRLAPFSGLHMTPEQWLHGTVLRVGPAAAITRADMDKMLARAEADLCGVKPVKVTFGPVFYHPQAIALPISPADALRPVFHAAQAAARDVTGTVASASAVWAPHMTLCYSEIEQPAAPVIAALGRKLPSHPVAISEVSLVVQHGPEQHWDWEVAGIVRLPA